MTWDHLEEDIEEMFDRLSRRWVQQEMIERWCGNRRAAQLDAWRWWAWIHSSQRKVQVRAYRKKNRVKRAALKVAYRKRRAADPEWRRKKNERTKRWRNAVKQRKESQ